MTRERREAAATEQETRTLKRAMVLIRAHTAPVDIVVFLTEAQGIADAIRTEGEES